MSSDTFQGAVAAATERYVSRNQKSKALHEEAVKIFPGGNTRTVLHTNPFPLCMKSGKGYQVFSEDGDTYVAPICADTIAKLIGTATLT